MANSASPRQLSERLPYRLYLFKELIGITSSNYWAGKRILEIGPKDGDDSRRLASLKPGSFVLIDLPEKTAVVQSWFPALPEPKEYIEANISYMSVDMIENLGKFDLIWFTGVLYHNAEQLRLLRQLYKMLNVDGYLVLESVMLQDNSALAGGDYVRIYYPQRHRDTASITHLPSKGAIKAWLRMVGFLHIQDSNCYAPETPDLIGHRYAAICRKTGEDDGDYFYNSNLEGYRFGDST